eukprot:TRINITY_DN4624_c0_g2_i1.p4 TRINITY_DN4624_c0_g2~~TRINITY_DN4624_c0_g2_i1.p4  ORF type:complete len:133 (+),score=8.92 TRINITY_DN4624_c0_g2_i1:753-1151(+)
MLPFARPHLSESFREFWGKRWNTAVGGVFRIYIYRPIQERFQHKIVGKVVGLFAVFLMSGFLHEYMVFNLCGKFTGENLLFFELQFAIIVLEEWAQKRGYLIPWRWARVLAFNTIQCVLGYYLMFAPFVRCK